MRRLTRRKQHSGGYLYTRNAKRGAWINSLSWSGPQLLNILKKIPWDSFEYKGEVVYTDESENNNENNNESSGFRINTQKELRVIPGIVIHSKRPYTVFGGAACELWSTVFPDPPIRKYVDPTSDIDINIMPFNFKVLPTGNRLLNKIYTSKVKNQDSVQNIHMYGIDRYTAFGDTYTKWLFNQTVIYCRKIAKTFQQTNLVLPEMKNTSETAFADMAQAVGPLLITRMVNFSKKHCKIQISTKVRRSNIEETNHLLEFIIPSQLNVNEYISKSFQVRGIFLEEPYSLFRGQIKGLHDRGDPYMKYLQDHPEIQHANIPKAEFFYKYENHCGRILWLFQICREAERIVKHGGVPAYYQFSVGQLEYYIKEILREKVYMLCTFAFGDKYIENLLQIADMFKNVSPGTFTNPESAVRRRILST